MTGEWEQESHRSLQGEKLFLISILILSSENTSLASTTLSWSSWCFFLGLSSLVAFTRLLVEAEGELNAESKLSSCCETLNLTFLILLDVLLLGPGPDPVVPNLFRAGFILLWDIGVLE